MFKKKIIISITIFVTFLVITSAIKNKTRLIEKNISNLKVLINCVDETSQRHNFTHIFTKMRQTKNNFFPHLFGYRAGADNVIHLNCGLETCTQKIVMTFTIMQCEN